VSGLIKPKDQVWGQANLARALEIFEELGSLVEPDTVRKELDELSNS
jgi:hypothetical protein